MRIWSFYDPATGVIDGHHFSGSARAVAFNTPPGRVCIEGAFDHLSQRVELTTGFVVDFQPPAPDADHDWDARTRRWILKAAIAARNIRHEQALGRIAILEGSQARALREAALDQPGAKERLANIDREIATLRAMLTERTR